MNGRAILAWNIKRLRAERGLSQERLAHDSGLDRAYVSEIEREIGNATVDVLDRLSAVLAVSLAELLAHPGPDAVRPTNLRPGRRRQGT